jgi:hypothetical protein
MNPYTFFVGCPRSGTTLLQRLGDAHPELSVIHETRWLARFFDKRLGLTPDGRVTPEVLARLERHARFKALKMERDELEPALTDGDGAPASYPRFVSAVFDLYGQKRGKRLVGDKTPGYVRQLSTLTRLWPEAKIVHIIRDGRDVGLSVRDWHKGAALFPTWDEDPIVTSALWWEWHVRLGREQAAALGPGRYHELRYEALVAAPERECERLCAFLGIAYDASMMRFHEGRVRDDPQLDAKKAWRPVTAGLRSWRSQLPVADAQRFDAVCGPLLDELGYERAATAPRDGPAVGHAARLRDSFAAEARSRGWPVPSGWAVA